MKLKLAITKYLDWKRSYAPVASKAYSPCLRRFEEYIKKDLERITINDVASFIELVGVKYSPRYVVYHVNVLKDFFGFYDTQVRPKLIRKPKFTPQPQDFVSETEFRLMDRVLNEWEFYDLRKKIAIHLLWHTGIRVSELCDLNILDIENSKTYAKIITKKNKQYRWIWWSGEAHQLLMRYVGTKIAMNEHPALFSSQQGRITRRQVERWVHEVALKAGITRNVYPHMFRHGKAHKILSSGGNLNDVKEVLGHRSIVSTQLYTMLDPQEFSNLARKFV